MHEKRIVRRTRYNSSFLNHLAFFPTKFITSFFFCRKVVILLYAQPLYSGVERRGINIEKFCGTTIPGNFASAFCESSDDMIPLIFLDRLDVIMVFQWLNKTFLCLWYSCIVNDTSGC